MHVHKYTEHHEDEIKPLTSALFNFNLFNVWVIEYLQLYMVFYLEAQLVEYQYVQICRG